MCCAVATSLVNHLLLFSKQNVIIIIIVIVSSNNLFILELVSISTGCLHIIVVDVILPLKSKNSLGDFATLIHTSGSHWSVNNDRVIAFYIIM